MKNVIIPLAAALITNLATADNACGHSSCSSHSHNQHQYGCSHSYSDFFLLPNEDNRQFGGDLHLQIVSEKTYRAPESDEEINNTFAHAHLDTFWQITDNLRLDSRLNLEEAHNHGGHHHDHDHESGNRFFDEHQLTAEELYLSYEFEDTLLIYGGKFNPEVGFNYHVMPGYLGYQQLEEYAIREKVGTGLKYKLDAGKLGTYIFNGSLFQSDTTFLSNSLLHQRGHHNIEDGGPATHGGLRSYAVSLKNQPYQFKTGSLSHHFNWQIGYARQAGSADDYTAETRNSISAQHVTNITENLLARAVIEHVDITHLNGEADHNRKITTTGAEIRFKRWEIGTSYTHIDNNAEEDDETINAWSYQGSIGYHFTKNFALQTGFKKVTEGGESKESAGVSLLYSLNF